MTTDRFGSPPPPPTTDRWSRPSPTGSSTRATPSWWPATRCHALASTSCVGMPTSTSRRCSVTTSSPSSPCSVSATPSTTTRRSSRRHRPPRATALAPSCSPIRYRALRRVRQTNGLPSPGGTSTEKSSSEKTWCAWQYLRRPRCLLPVADPLEQLMAMSFLLLLDLLDQLGAFGEAVPPLLQTGVAGFPEH